MGGKTKQAQRTKNNARPSSSGRSAELLSNVKLEGTLLGMTKLQPALFPSLAASALDQGLNQEFQMAIKKLNKKDPITKTKALQELCELVNNSEVDDVVAALPSWAHFYKILTADTDRKVRENTQITHGTIVRVCGRRVAPQLRALLPAWLQAQHDDHAPAQAQAQLSLSNTFPDSKLPEVVSFCKVEVMAHFLENLLDNTNSPVLKKIEDPEERELQLCRIVSSSLQGLGWFVSRLPPQGDGGDWLRTTLAPLLKAPAFWKYATHTHYQIRAAWFAAVGRMVERLEAWFGEQVGARTVRAALAGREPSALVAAQRWGCLLLFMHHVQDWHKYMDKKELLSKRILDVLETGGWGEARQLADILLPLLAHLPADLLTKDFYHTFFNAIFKGLEKKSILTSKSERQSWITSLAECLRYLSVQEHEFVLEVASAVHRAWLEAALSPKLDPPVRTNLIKCSANNMASLLKYWLKLAHEGNSEKYDQLTRNFWQNIGSTVQTQIDKLSMDADEITAMIEAHILLLESLKSALTHEAKKQHSIKFDDDEPTESIPTPPSPQHTPPAVVERYNHNLSDIVEKICAHYFLFAAKTQTSKTVLTPLLSLVVEFESEQLLVGVARQFGAESVFQLYDTVLRGWAAGDTMRCQPLLDLVFMTLNYLTDREMDAVFDSFQQFPPSVVEWCLRRSVAHPHVSRGAARRWLAGRVAGPALAALAARVVRRPDSRDTQLLLQCLRPVDGDLLISSQTVNAIITTLNTALSIEEENLESLAALAARVATSLHDRAPSDQYIALLLHLFDTNLRVHRGGSELSVATWCEVRSSWQDALAALPDSARGHLRGDARGQLHRHLALRDGDLYIGELEHVMSLTPHLLDHEGRPEPSDVIAFTQQMFLLQTEDKAPVETRALRLDCITNKLNCPFDDDNDLIKAVVEHSDSTDELTKLDFVTYANKVLFRAIYLRTVLLHKCEEDEESWCNELLTEEYLQQELCTVLYDYVVVCSLHQGYAFWEHYKLIQETKQKLDALLEAVINETACDIRVKILSTLSHRAATVGYYWSYARRYYGLMVGEGDQPTDAEDTLDITNLEEIVTGNGYFHTLQANTASGSEEAQLRCSYLVMVRSVVAAHGNDPTLLQDIARCHRANDPEPVVNLYYRHNHTMLYDRDISDAGWRVVVSNACIAECLVRLVARGWDAAPLVWDFTNITLCSLVSSLYLSRQHWNTTKVAMLVGPVVRLFLGVERFVGSVPARCMRCQPAAHVAALPAEWGDMFAPPLHRHLLLLLTHLLDSASPGMSAAQAQVVGALMAACGRLAWGAARPAPALRAAVGSCARAYRTVHHHAYKYAAHALCRALAKTLVLEDAEKLAAWSDESESEGSAQQKPRPVFSLQYFHDAYTHLEEVVDAALAHVQEGSETCEMVPFTDSYSLCVGWLLMADTLAELGTLARGDLLQHYIQYYREHQSTEKLLVCSLRLLPSDVFMLAQQPVTTPPVGHRCANMFLAVEEYNINECATSAQVSSLACRGVFSAAGGAGGGAARAWRGAAPPRAARLLERLVRAFVAPPLVRRQLANVQRRANELHDATVQIHWSSNEAVCVYMVEERPVELQVCLSREHPLSPPRLAAVCAPAAAAHTQWLAVYLAYQHGSLLNAFKMWMSAVSARVQAAPQCFICYCRLHPSSGHLPRVTCHTCKNKFHNACLRKWFATSNKSNCPLCRAAF